MNEKETITSMLNDSISNFSETIDSLIKLYEDTRPKLIKRVYRKKGKRYYRTMLRYNPVYDILPSPSFLNMMLRHICRKK